MNTVNSPSKYGLRANDTPTKVTPSKALSRPIDTVTPIKSDSVTDHTETITPIPGDVAYPSTSNETKPTSRGYKGESCQKPKF